MQLLRGSQFPKYGTSNDERMSALSMKILFFCHGRNKHFFTAMPRRAHAAARIEAEDSHSGGPDDSEMVGSEAGSAVSLDVLRLKAREWLDLTAQIKELGAQTALLRKSLKEVEKSLYNGMALSHVEEVEIDGQKISRIKKLKLAGEE